MAYQFKQFPCAVYRLASNDDGYETRTVKDGGALEAALVDGYLEADDFFNPKPVKAEPKKVESFKADPKK